MMNNSLTQISSLIIPSLRTSPRDRKKRSIINYTRGLGVSVKDWLFPQQSSPQNCPQIVANLVHFVGRNSSAEAKITSHECKCPESGQALTILAPPQDAAKPR